MKSRSVLAVSIFALFILMGISFAMADDNSSSNSTQMFKNWTSVCSKINETVSQKIQAFDDGKVKRINAYNNSERMIESLISKLKEKGADTTQAEADYQDLQAKVSQFSVDYSSFIIKLESLKAYTCGNSSGAYASQLKGAKSMLPLLRNESIAVRETVMKIKLDLVQARGNILIAKLGQKANKTMQNYQNRISQIENRTGRIENRVENRTSQIESRMSRLENKTGAKA